MPGMPGGGGMIGGGGEQEPIADMSPLDEKGRRSRSVSGDSRLFQGSSQDADVHDPGGDGRRSLVQ